MIERVNPSHTEYVVDDDEHKFEKVSEEELE